MTYVVRIGYRDFGFNDALEAIAFADRAMKHFMPDKAEDSIKVEIELVNDEPAEAENKED